MAHSKNWKKCQVDGQDEGGLAGEGLDNHFWDWVADPRWNGKLSNTWSYLNCMYITIKSRYIQSCVLAGESLRRGHREVMCFLHFEE